MTAISWPASLPTRPEQQGFQEELGSGTDRSNVETGKPQYRNRSTAKPDKLSCSLVLTTDQAATFDTFFCATTNYGCLRFTWKDALGNAATCRFASAPELKLTEADAFRASFDYEVLR